MCNHCILKSFNINPCVKLAKGTVIEWGRFKAFCLSLTYFIRLEESLVQWNVQWNDKHAYTSV